MEKRKVSILFGGVSSEHDASVKSFEHILNELKQVTEFLKFEICDIIYLTRERDAIINEFKNKCSIDDYMVGIKQSLAIVFGNVIEKDRFVYSVLHGQNGEDGNFQGLSKFLGLKGNHGSTLSCSLGMSKYHMNNYVCNIDNLQLPKTCVIRNESEMNLVSEIFMNQDIIIKPNSLGASLFTKKIRCSGQNNHEIQELITTILQYDSKVLVQDCINGNEYTCGCLKINGDIKILPLINIVTKNNFFGHDEKHISGLNNEIIVYEHQETKQLELIKEISKKLFFELDFQNKARFDYIINNDGIFFLEVNPFPGLMKNSLFTKMLKAAEISIMKLIEIEMENFYIDDNKQTTIHYKID